MTKIKLRWRLAEDMVEGVLRTQEGNDNGGGRQGGCGSRHVWTVWTDRGDTGQETGRSGLMEEIWDRKQEMD